MNCMYYILDILHFVDCLRFLHGTIYAQELQKDLTPQLVTDVFPGHLHRKVAFLHACFFMLYSELEFQVCWLNTFQLQKYDHLMTWH
jgi:hypothetical protein